ncbi:type VII secretion AAA-ATPase EccA [Gordonia shandongensis]|uniref:type VII secretion AAA-ATPase EccA n=1 Tax=Gordonia shandongensis TaxID=376351 RepID=UPI00040EC666|nr:type VII secretion AAA-ATPase EccA [Gordonia shandongensis]
MTHWTTRGAQGAREGREHDRYGPDARTRARDCLVAGLTAAGILVGDRPPDRERARRALIRATELDPTMGDAWLGRVAVGDRSGPVLLGLYRARSSIGAEQRRLGLRPGALAGHLPTGMFIDLPIVDAVDASAAYAASLLAGGDTDGAAAVLDDAVLDEPGLDGGAATAEPSVRFCRALVALRRHRWREVLDAVAAGWDDEVLVAAADFLAGSACAHLGLFDEALRRLDAVDRSCLHTARAQTAFLIGMVHRARGDEAAARASLERSSALDPGIEEARRALADPTYRLATAPDTPAPDTSAPDTSAPGTSAPDTRAPAIPAPGSVAAGSTAPDPSGESERDAAVASAVAELSAQVGLAEVKEQVERLRASVTLARLRAERGLRTGPRSLHLAFTGPPGTGKTTVARIIARLYCALGLLATDTVVEAGRADLVGRHLGSTAPRTSAVVDSALDGVLFIDEAYTLIQEGLSGGDAFGREALDTLLARMENDRDRLVVIIAGYDDEIDRLLAANEGLASRFARRIRFSSYTPGELTRIAESIAAQRDARLSPEAADALENAFTALYADTAAGRRASDVAGNGRFVRNVIEAAEEERELRLAADSDLSALDEAALMTITGTDAVAALDRLR